MSENSEIRDTLEVVKAITESIPVYDDLLKPSVKELGKSLHVATRAVGIALAPLSALVWSYDTIKEKISDTIAQKLEKLPAEKFGNPDLNIVGPSIEALRFTGHKSELRELFMNLIATSIDTTTSNLAHPAFVDIIKQMSADEALIMKSFCYNNSQPIITIKAVGPNGYGSQVLLENYSDIPKSSGAQNPEHGPVYLVHLQRVGLINLDMENHLVSPESANKYHTLSVAVEILELKEKMKNENRITTITNGIASLTDFGILFCKACILENMHH